MGAGQRRPSLLAAVPVPLLLLIVVSFGSQAAAAGGAPVWTTALQQHVAYFDTDNDGIVTYSETEEGLRRIGLGAATATAAALLINGVIGPKTRPNSDKVEVRWPFTLEARATRVITFSCRRKGFIGDNATTSRMDIYVENIHKGMHGSDTGSYDAQGRFVQAKFDEIFVKYANAKPNALNQTELEEMRHANRGSNDYSGWAASKAEWDMLYSLAKDNDGFLQKDTARAVYNGSLFVTLAKQNGI